MKIENQKSFDELADKEYKYGFVTDIESDSLPPGLDEEIVRAISHRKNEPEWLTEWRVKAYHHWTTLEPPTWALSPRPPPRGAWLPAASSRVRCRRATSTWAVPS